MRKTKLGKGGVGRGVWVAPWMGPEGELILVAVGRDNRMVGEPRMVGIGESHMQASDDLWDLLERSDPMPMLKII